jgi:hypothetical protein
MATHMTNKSINQLLSDLGFQPGGVGEKNHRTWRHAESACVLILPANRVDEAARQADIIGVRSQLALQGHLDEESFDYFAVEGRLPASA